jgi:hypothetical protein
MYEIISNRRNVNGIDIETWKREIDNHNIIEVEVGTNGLRGGASKEGGRTYFRITDCACTEMYAHTKNGCLGKTEEIEITFGGDAELETFIAALKFAVKVLESETYHGKEEL